MFKTILEYGIVFTGFFLASASLIILVFGAPDENSLANVGIWLATKPLFALTAWIGIKMTRYTPKTNKK